MTEMWCEHGVEMLGKPAMIEAMQRALDKAQCDDSTDVKDVCDGVRRLGYCLTELGLYDAALQVSNKVLALSMRLWSDRDHSDVASGLHQLASIRRSLGNLGAALEAQQASVDMDKRL